LLLKQMVSISSDAIWVILEFRNLLVVASVPLLLVFLSTILHLVATWSHFDYLDILTMD
jgi:hypothetical protein